MNTLLASLGAGFFLVWGLWVAFRKPTKSPSWVPVAALSAVFLIFSVYTIASEGLLGFWDDHTRNFWGNQVWFDLLLAASVAWTVLAPRARAAGMKLPVWFLVVASGGSIGLLAMVARLLYLESRSGN